MSGFKPKKPYDWKRNQQARDSVVWDGKRVELTAERKKMLLEGIQNLAVGFRAMGISAIIGVNFNDGSGDAEGLSALVGSKEELNEIFKRMQEVAKNGAFDQFSDN